MSPQKRKVHFALNKGDDESWKQVMKLTRFLRIWAAMDFNNCGIGGFRLMGFTNCGRFRKMFSHNSPSMLFGL